MSLDGGVRLSRTGRCPLNSPSHRSSITYVLKTMLPWGSPHLENPPNLGRPAGVTWLSFHRLPGPVMNALCWRSCVRWSKTFGAMAAMTEFCTGSQAKSCENPAHTLAFIVDPFFSWNRFFCDQFFSVSWKSDRKIWETNPKPSLTGGQT